MVKDAYGFAIPPIVLGVLCLGFGWYWAAGILIFLGLFVFYFFRDPERAIPSDPGVVVSPADGHVVEIVDESLDSKRAPWAIASAFSFPSGTCTCSARRSRDASRSVVYRPGRFYAAFRAAASRENEQNVIYMDTPRGPVGLQTNCRSNRAPRDMLETRGRSRGPRASAWA